MDIKECIRNILTIHGNFSRALNLSLIFNIQCVSSFPLALVKIRSLVVVGVVPVRLSFTGFRVDPSEQPRRYVPISKELSYDFCDITPTNVEVPNFQKKLGSNESPAMLTF